MHTFVSAVLASLLALSGALPQPGLAARRAQHLRHGINLSHWFAQVFDPKGYTPEHFDSYMTDRDIALIHKMGFDHVRFTIEPAPMFDEKAPGQLPEAYLALLDREISTMLANDLAVVVDIHPTDELKIRLREDDEFVAAFAEFWRALAAHMSKFDADRVFLEILNEPMATDRYRWMGIQAKLVEAIRRGAPRHTIIATGANWSSTEELLFLEPVADANVIYTFHFYDPHTYTHQGATWGADYWKFLTRVPYPSSPEAVAPILPTVTNEDARRALQDYGDERWNAKHVDAEIAKAAAWGRKYDVPLYCGEFGVYRRYALPEERAAWLRDVRTALERHHVGWSMWDYAGGFSVVTRQNGTSEPDAATLTALGLK